MKWYLVVGLAGLAALSSVGTAWGQGCIVARSNGEVGGPSSEGGYLVPGQFNFDIGYRHQFSFRHFVGPTEQTYRIEQGNQVMNKINLENFGVTYQLTTRYSVTADIPLFSASRRSHNSPVTYTSSGIGDSAVMFNGWVWNPKENSRGNVQFGIGVLFPTGKDNVSNNVASTVGGTPVNTIVDYSIQPGQGGWGMPLQWAAYKNIPGNQLYFNGSYTAMLQSVNKNVLRTNATANPTTLLQYNSISDQYLLEAGVAHPLSMVKGLTFTFGPRWEGVPARNLIPGDNLGFRRPGFAISVEPGVQYVHGSSVFTAEIARAMYRDRTRSVTDLLTGGHGDAAFADWVWLASYSFRFDPHPMAAHHDTTHQMPDHSAPAAAPASNSATATTGSK